MAISPELRQKILNEQTGLKKPASINNLDYLMKLKGSVEPEKQGFFARGSQATQSMGEATKEATQDIKQTFGGIKEAIGSAQENVADIRQSAKDEEIGGGSRALQVAGESAAGVSNVFGEVIKGGVKLFAGSDEKEQKTKGDVVKFIQKVGEVSVPVLEKETGTFTKTVPLKEALGNTAEQFKEAINWDQLSEEQQNNLIAGGRIIELASEFIGGGTVKKGATLAAKTAGDVVEAGVTIASKNIDEINSSIGTGIQNMRRSLANAIPDLNPIDKVRKSIPFQSPQDMAEQKNLFVNTLKDVVVSDRTGTNKKLNKLALRNDTDTEQLLLEVAEEGGVPDIKGNKTDFTSFKQSINNENRAISEAINRRAAQLTEQTNTDDLRKAAIQHARTARATAANLDVIENRINKTFNNYKKKKYGKNLSPENINEIRVEMNRKWKGRDPEQFEVDAFNSIGSVSRKRLTEIEPSLTDATAHQAKLNRVLDTVNALDLQKIDVNQYLEKMGGFAGTMLAGGLGISALAGGPAGLLIAGLAANIGSSLLAKAIRKKTFSPERFNLIKNSINENPEILQKLIRDADDSDKLLLEKELINVDFDEVAIESL